MHEKNYGCSKKIYRIFFSSIFIISIIVVCVYTAEKQSQCKFAILYFCSIVELQKYTTSGLSPFVPLLLEN